MKVPSWFMNRRDFTNSSLLAGSALVSGVSRSLGAGPSERRIRTGVIGCGSVSKELLVTPEQALHVLEIITAARESSATGRRVKLMSTFKWPIVT
jgi:hypothetical protein